MHISLDRFLDSSLIPFLNFRYKPLVYLVAAVALSVFCLYLIWNHANKLQKQMINPLATSERKSEQRAQNLDFTLLSESSAKFASHTSFPTQDNLIANLATTPEMKAEVVEHAMNTRPILPGRLWSFIPKFMAFKKEHGSPVEKKLYQSISIEDLINRLIQKRPLMFMTGGDFHLLKNGQKGVGGFDKIGQEDESGELLLENYQSYSEMQLAAFLSVFVPTHFINNGDRHNKGIKGSKGSYEPKGIYAAMVGARFEKPGFMDWAHMIVTPDQNTAKNGYGLEADPQNPKTIELRLWAEVYKCTLGENQTYAFTDYETAKQDKTGRFVKKGENYLDTFVYKQRMKLVVESFLLEANERAKQQGKKAYLHVVGLGLGVWMFHSCQTELLLQAYAEVLKEHTLNHISDINFSYLNAKVCGGVPDQGIFDSKGHPIKIHFSKRNPADKLKTEDEQKLLIAQYAWDSNAYPGNEYWDDMLTASGDPAAACCSTIPELQNPDINPHLIAENLAVRGEHDLKNPFHVFIKFLHQYNPWHA